MEQPMTQEKEINELSVKILTAIDGESFDDLVPAVTLVLADIGVSSGVDVDVFVGFVSNSIRTMFRLHQESEKLH